MPLLIRSTQERMADARRDAARLREQATELRELSALMGAPVPRERMHVLAGEAEAAARTMEDMVEALARELESEG